METLVERGSSYEHVEVSADFQDLPDPYDQVPENNQEQEPTVSEVQYIEGPDGFYACDPETGEAVLSMPLIISGEQQDTIKTVLTDGIASIDVPTDFGTDEEEVWSLQTFSLSDETPDGRRIITLRAVMERRPKYKEEELQDQSDTFDITEQAAAITEARAAVEAAIINSEAPYTPRPEPKPIAEPVITPHPPERVEKTPVFSARIEQPDAAAEVTLTEILRLQAQPETALEPKINQKTTPLEAAPIFEEPQDVDESAIQPPITIKPEQSEVSQRTPMPIETAAVVESCTEEITESQPDAEPAVEASASAIEPLTELKDEAVVSDEPSQFELPPAKQEPVKPPTAAKKAKPRTLPVVQKIITVAAKVQPLAATTPASTAKKTITPAATPLTQPVKKQNTAIPPETHVKSKKVIKTAPQEAPVVIREAAKQEIVEQAAPAHETIAATPLTAKEVAHDTDEESFYNQNQPKRTAERAFKPRIVTPLETPAPLRVSTSNEQLHTPAWEQERNAQRLASVLTSQHTAATDVEDIVISFAVSTPSRRAPRAHAARSIAA